MKETVALIEELGLSKDSYDYLKRNGIETIESLLHLPVSALAGSGSTELCLVAEILYKVSRHISDNLETESQCAPNPAECIPSTFAGELSGNVDTDFKEKNITCY